MCLGGRKSGHGPFFGRPDIGGGSGVGGYAGGSGSGGTSGGASGGGKSGEGARGASGGGSSSGPQSVFGGLWSQYNRALASRPILTKAMTSLVGFALGDVMAQKFLDGGGSGLNYARIARMASFGFLVHGPTGHYFYGMLDRLMPGQEISKVAAKVAIDQLCWAPIFTALFFAYLGVSERKSRREIVDKIKNDTMTGVKASWKVWPVAHAINFRFIPTSQRLLYINVIQVGYNVYLSLLGNK